MKMTGSKVETTLMWVVCLSSAIIVSCSDQSDNRERDMAMDDQLKQDLEAVGSMRVYFGHQSVGRNILQGLKEISADADSSALKVASPEEAARLSGPFFAESNIGKNGKPNTKCDAFRDVVNQNSLGDSLDVALLKFCYVDANAETNVEEMFAYYKQTVTELQKKHPGLALLHMTVPLTSRSPGWKRFIKNILRPDDPSDLEAYKRSAFNEMILREYGKANLFDLAGHESTSGDGTRSCFELDGKTVYTMLPEFTDDGGHLNAKGRRLVARELLRTLARVELGRHG